MINGSVKCNNYLLFFEENLEIFKYKTILHDNSRIHYLKHNTTSIIIFT
uniref:Uncharacterized protein n=1 Tax=viral metagenome TaxID=1070528 RepID=A0A6C0H8H0_9ZZZZ